MTLPSIIKEIPNLGIIEEQKSVMDFERLRFAKILMRQEKATLLWIRGTDLQHLSAFKLPMAELIRKEVLNTFLTQYRAGGTSLAKGLGKGRRTYESSRVRAKAKVMADKIISTIETELKDGWTTLSTTRQNKDWWAYHTKLVFSQLGGWKPPDGI